jgi:hypothetical protein
MLEGVSVMGRRAMKGGAILPHEEVEKEKPGRKKEAADCGTSSCLYAPIGSRAV